MEVRGLMRNVLLGFVASTALLATCGHDLGFVADMSGLDLSVRDVAADPPMSANCDKTWSYTFQNTKAIYYYAEFVVIGFDFSSPSHVAAVICDPTTAGVGPSQAFYPGCPVGSMCDPVPIGNCSSTSFTGGKGIIRVYCGMDLMMNGAPTAGFTVYAHAYIKID